MSSSNREAHSDPDHNLTPAELDNLDRLEAIAQLGLGTYVHVGSALAEIRDRHLYRDTHPSFEAYLRDRWAVNTANAELPAQTSTHADGDTEASPTAEPAPPDTPCEALTRACEQTLSALTNNEQLRIEIRFEVRREGDPGEPTDAEGIESADLAEPTIGELIPRLRWLLTQATGTLGLVAYQLETRATDIDDGAREKLKDDVLVLDDELATVKALLLELVDWDWELGRVLRDELPPFDTDIDTDTDTDGDTEPDDD